MSSSSEMPIPDTPRVLLEHHLKALRFTFFRWMPAVRASSA